VSLARTVGGPPPSAHGGQLAWSLVGPALERSQSSLESSNATLKLINPGCGSLLELVGLPPRRFFVSKRCRQFGEGHADVARGFGGAVSDGSWATEVEAEKPITVDLQSRRDLCRVPVRAGPPLLPRLDRAVGDAHVLGEFTLRETSATTSRCQAPSHGSFLLLFTTGRHGCQLTVSMAPDGCLPTIWWSRSFVVML
jgi:hypothetical protein